MRLFRNHGAVLVCCAIAAFLVSCSSLQQDVVVSSELLIHQEDVLAIESVLAKLDADAILGVGAENRTRMCRLLLEQIDAAFDDSGMQKALHARLYALQGRVLLLMGKKSDARASYADSVRSSKGDAQAAVLASRLGIIDDIEDKTLLAQTNQRPLLVLERALQLYAEGSYVDAVARMDEAFLSLDSFYKSAYQEIRDSAWSLRAASNAVSSVQELLRVKAVTVSDMAAITKETTTLLVPYVGAAAVTRSALYSALVKEGLLSPVSSAADGPALVPAIGDRATRILCARFLWNLYVSRKGRGAQKDRYSSAYAGTGESSPVSDVPISSPDFDAVLGCVENEIMELVDGERFFPDSAVSGVEFRTWVSRIK